MYIESVPSSFILNDFAVDLSFSLSILVPVLFLIPICHTLDYNLGPTSCFVPGTATWFRSYSWLSIPDPLSIPIPLQVGHDWGYYTMVTDLPKYTTDVLKYNVATAGLVNALPYLAMWVSSFIFGAVCDICIKKKWHSIKTGRIIHTTIAATGPAICIILASYAGCNGNLAVIYFIVSMALMGGFYSGMKVNALDLAPNYAGTLTSLVNSTSTLAGIITPYLTGLLTPDSTLKQWRVAFWVCFAVLVGTNVVYCIWADGKQQWWDDVRQYGYPEGWSHGPLHGDDLTTSTGKGNRDKSEDQELKERIIIDKS
ncbi:Putative inorganic phosphate cotransporter [Eumeta japonica]|uniref:Inorganic phosphate cotransporter n=1 Tax=Eumeta variegata TaxID=151549 RepID=A0A4C1YT19_EUMVA|nr:Putative inorganic phosphate cotransporter [Eumeta japonica]